jgi:hypothetical protein
LEDFLLRMTRGFAHQIALLQAHLHAEIGAQLADHILGEVLDLGGLGLLPFVFASNT